MTATTYRMRVDHEGKRRKVVVWRGVEGYAVRYTLECSGCTESEFGQSFGPNGCHECGYTGRRVHHDWVPFESSKDPRLLPQLAQEAGSEVVP